MDARRVLATKRDGGELSEGQIREFIAGYVAGELPDYQASALLMAIFVHGMTTPELECWTRAMLESGERFDFSALSGPKLDKHSTGGIGDKVSIPLAPAVAACGGRVPMISGRGLGHTGGTLDKLESIPGMRTELDEEHFARVVDSHGLAFGAQTAGLVPADRKLYALRDVTGLIESIPLIASSILSKKLAEGLDGLVLDVKFGSGAFLVDPARGAELARTMIELAGRFGLRACAFQTSMAAPLGRAAGHALEVQEALDVLRGAGPDDTRQLVLQLGGEMLFLGGLADTAAAGSERIAAVLADGSALELFARVVAAQGGEANALEDVRRIAADVEVERLDATRDGYLVCRDARAIGHALLELGGGRRQLGDEVDSAVGFVWHAKPGDRIRRGEPMAEIHHRNGHGLASASEELARALDIEEAEPERPPLVLARLEGTTA